MEFRKFGRFSGYFKKIEEYKEKTKFEHQSLTKEQQAAYDAEDRYCLHWGCEKIYKNVIIFKPSYRITDQPNDRYF